MADSTYQDLNMISNAATNHFNVPTTFLEHLDNARVTMERSSVPDDKTPLIVRFIRQHALLE